MQQSLSSKEVRATLHSYRARRYRRRSNKKGNQQVPAPARRQLPRRNRQPPLPPPPPPEDTVEEYTYVHHDNGNIDISIDGVLTLLVRPSALLQELGYEGLGLFAARPLARNYSLGYYSGLVLARSRRMQRCMFILQRQKRDQYLLDMTSMIPNPQNDEEEEFTIDPLYPLQSDNDQQRDFGYIPFPNAQYEYPGSYLHYINDPRGSEHPPNVNISKEGEAKTILPIPAYDPAHPNNIASEILWNYGESYWNGRVLPPPIHNNNP